MYSAHNHSYLSILDALRSPEEVVQQAYDLGFKAVSLSEHGNMHSVLDGYKKAKELGIKFVPACEIYETDDIDGDKSIRNRFHLLLLAKDNEGYINLNKIVTEGWQRGKDNYGYMRVDRATIAKYSKGIIGASACLGGRLARLLVPKDDCPCCSGYDADNCDLKDWHIDHSPKWEDAKALVLEYKSIFPDGFYLEMQNHNTPQQARLNKLLVKMSEETGIPLIITFDSHMVGREDIENHKMLVKMNPARSKKSRTDENDLYTYEGCWMTSIDGIHEVMDSQVGTEIVDLAIANTDLIADMCNVEIKLHQNLMPKIEIPAEFKDDRAYLKHLVNQGFKKRGFNKLPSEQKKKYIERLQKEFEMLDYLEYCSYFIMNEQLISRMHERGIPMGYSRGSGGNCLTLYGIGVTEIDSIRWDLDFTRFGNKGRKGSAADYDIDMSQARRHEALEIAVELFGRDRIAHMCTFTTMTPKVAINDIGKVLDEEQIYELPYKLRQEMTKLVNGDTIETSLESNSKLRRYAEEFPLLFEYTKVLQNKPKSVGTHASAIAIADVSLVEFSPLMLSDEGYNVLQLEMHNAQDDLGLIKMDFLGLDTADVVDRTLKLTGLTWADIALDKLDLDDQDVFREIFGKGNILGIFQCEKEVPRQMGIDMQVNNINDIFAITALNRPAILQLGADKVYIRNKKDPSKIEYIHPDLQTIFGETHGIMLYQEQALAVFRLAGFPEDETDKARRAIGKKKPEVMAELKEKLISGLGQSGWTEDQAVAIWEVLEAQADYSFNKGHSTAYGLLAYVTAYLKHHYPVEFMTALLTSEVGNYAKMSKYINEARRMGIEVVPPDINLSEMGFNVHKDGSGKGKILFGLTAIRGVGETAAHDIMVGRPYKNFNDFHERCRFDQSTNVALLQAGCFGINRDELLRAYGESLYETREFRPVIGIPKKSILMELDLIRTDAEFKDKDTCRQNWNDHKRKLHEQEQVKRYEKHMQEFEGKYMASPEMYEYNTLSMFIGSHPFRGLPEKYLKPFESIEDGKKFVIGGTISRVERKKQKDGMTYAYIDILTLDPDWPLIEGVCFGKIFAIHSELIKRGNNVVIMAKKSGDQFICNDFQTLEEWLTHLEKLEKEAG